MYAQHGQEQIDAADERYELQHMRSVADDLEKLVGVPEDTDTPSVNPAAPPTGLAAIPQSLDDRIARLAPSQGTVDVGLNEFDVSGQALANRQNPGITSLDRTFTDGDGAERANRPVWPGFGHPARPYPMQAPLDPTHGPSYQSIPTQLGRPIDDFWPKSFASLTHDTAPGHQYVGFSPDTTYSQTEPMTEEGHVSALTPCGSTRGHASPTGQHGTSSRDSDVSASFSDASNQGPSSTRPRTDPPERSPATTSGRARRSRGSRGGKTTASNLSGKEKKAPPNGGASRTGPKGARLALEQLKTPEWHAQCQQWQQWPIKTRIHGILAREAKFLSSCSPNQLVPLTRRVCGSIPSTRESCDSITKLLVAESKPASEPGMGLEDQNSREYLVSAVNIISASIVRAQKSVKGSSKESESMNVADLEVVLGNSPVVTFAALPPNASPKDYRCDTCKLTAESVCVMPATLQDVQGNLWWMHEACSRCLSGPDPDPAKCSKYTQTVSERSVDYKGVARSNVYQHPLLSKLLSTVARQNVEVKTREGQPSDASRYFPSV